jgi:hypothetical protein
MTMSTGGQVIALEDAGRAAFGLNPVWPMF